MAKFSFKAVKASGEVYTGVAEAQDQYALARRLKESGTTLVSAEPAGGAKGVLSKLNISFGKIKLREKILFARNLSAMLIAGLSLSRALSVLERQTHNKKFEGMLSGIRGKIQEGAAFSEALAGFPDTFPPIFVSMVKAGEESGNVAEALANLSEQMDKTYQLKRRVRGAMMYPSIVVSAMILVGIVMLMFVVPTLTETFRELNIELPASTRIVIGVSDFLKNNALLSGGLIALFIGVCVVLWRQKPTRHIFERMLLHFPLVGGLIKETNAARTARTLSSLLVSGVEMVVALGITKDVIQNSHYQKVLGEAEERIQKGSPLSATFLAHEKLYPVLVGEMMSVGEETGNLPEMLKRVADFYESEVEQKTKDMSTIIEPFLMVFIGAVVGFFAVSMISPIYSISSGI